MVSAAVSKMQNAWQARFFRWLDRRSPKKNTHHLTRKNLYIFPTKQGFMFLGLVSVLWLLGTNYQNNLILALSFLLVSLFVLSILQTYANLAGIDIEYKGAGPSFAGDQTIFFLTLTNTHRGLSDGIALRWQDSNLEAKVLALDSKQVTTVELSVTSGKRGVLLPGRLLVESFYPLGLLRCWTWLNIDASALVYPKPVDYPLQNSSVEDEDGDGAHPVKGGDDFNAFHEYRPGDSPKHVAWKIFARGGSLVTKEFSQNTSREIWLDFYQINTEDVELKLSAMCFWTLQFHLQDENFGVILPGEKIFPDKGENHKAKVLEALSLY